MPANHACRTNHCQSVGLTPLRKVMSHRLDVDYTPNKLHFVIGADRGTPCPRAKCGATCMTSRYTCGGILTSSSISRMCREERRGIEFIQPGKPKQNSCMSVSKAYREGSLDFNLFKSLAVLRKLRRIG